MSCAENEGKFYLKRFARGSIGKCVLFRNRWLTPNEFQTISGRKSSKDWKRSIRLKGRILKDYITQGLFQEHSKACVCKICCGGDMDLMKQEGEMALAAKRRRLSQADSAPPLEPRPILSPPVAPMVTSSVAMPTVASSPPPLVSSLKRERSRKALVKLEPVESNEREEHSKNWNTPTIPEGNTV